MAPDNALHVRKAPDNASSVRILPDNALHVRKAPDNALHVRIPPANARLPSRAARALLRPHHGAPQFHPAPRSLR